MEITNRQLSMAYLHSSKDVRVDDAYWCTYIDLVQQTILPYQWEALNDRVPDAEPSHCMRNFRIAAGLEEGTFAGEPFQDTDLYKWLEAVGYALLQKPNEELEQLADGAIELIASAQQPDGYVNTFFTINRLHDRWTNLTELHEMYSAGHLIEAAVAYYIGTGKTKLLDVARQLADHIDRQFGPNPDQIQGYDGHQEIELALVKLYEVTGEQRYLELSTFMINERGQNPSFFLQEWEARGCKSHFIQERRPNLTYRQAHLPVREQDAAAGHAVRAVYMYSAMADLALHNQDQTLLAACRRLWSNIVQKQMYVNGSIGSTHHGEAFTFDYDLPNDTNYSETCASIGLIFFAQRMLQLEARSEYADVMERTLYNAVTSGMGKDGKHYFYVNPMEVWPAASAGNPGKHHIKATRQKWYGCACCPPNVARLLMSLQNYIYSTLNDTLYVHLYIGSELHKTVGGQKLHMKLDSDLPWQGSAKVHIVGAEGDGTSTIALRMPAWSQTTSFTIQGVAEQPDIRDGYAYFTRVWAAGDIIEIHMDMTPRRIYANPEVRANAGRVALQRGPFVYCFEEVDNAAPLASLTMSQQSALTVIKEDSEEGIVFIEADGFQIMPSEDHSLYRTQAFLKEPKRLRAIPYPLWGNRTPGEMLVWIRE